MDSYRDLIVWQKSMSMVTDIYTVTRGFPKEEVYGLVSQIRRSAISIPSNIAEGYGRHGAKEYGRYLQISRGSLYELQTQLEVCININYLNDNELKKILPVCDEIGKMLNSMIKKLRERG
ncbi:MAG: four helix bundle protein [Planctomycetes bacterium]|nr:four helix bundle protein [Planctomycetota bacterium]